MTSMTHMTSAKEEPTHHAVPGTDEQLFLLFLPTPTLLIVHLPGDKSQGLGVLRAAWWGEDTHLHLPYPHVPLPELRPKGMDFWGHPSGWPLLWFQSLNDLGIKQKKKSQASNLDYNDSDILQSQRLIAPKASRVLGNTAILLASFCFVV